MLNLNVTHTLTLSLSKGEVGKALTDIPTCRASPANLILRRAQDEALVGRLSTSVAAFRSWFE